MKRQVQAAGTVDRTCRMYKVRVYTTRRGGGGVTFTLCQSEEICAA